MKRNSLLKVFSSLLLFVMCSSCTDLRLEIEELKNRMDSLEGMPVPEISEQMISINSSITDLHKMDEALDGYIKALESVSTDLQKQIDDVQVDVTVLEQSLLNEINTAKKTIQKELTIINKTLDDLKAADDALEAKIADLQTYVDAELATTKDWANATFSTLAQYEQVQAEISGIKASIELINADIKALGTRLSDKIAIDIKTAVDALRAELDAELIARIESAVKDVTSAYSEAISSAMSDITAAYTAAISSAIAASESGLKKWVGEQLSQGYYDIATLDGMLSALAARLDDTDIDLQNQISEHQVAIGTLKEELTKAYKDAINDAIAENNGVISAAIASAVKEVEDELQKQIDAVSLAIEALTDSLANLEEAFVNRIQSLKFIPEFSDRKVKFSDMFEAVLNFMVAPEKQADALAEAWSIDRNIVKAYLRYTAAPSTRAVCEPIELTVESVVSNGKGDICVVVKGNTDNPLMEDFWSGIHEAVVYLRISDGSNDVISELIDVVGYIQPVVSLSELGTANSYVVSESGMYKFATSKGNSAESVGGVASAEVLWESFGTDVAPNVGDLIKSVSYRNGYISFQTSNTFKEGNAVIAAKDASGKILWSWHIWLTDQPEGQEYYNNAGTMMDRNLGATSATPGDVGSLGLYYQWGRKDPFLGSSSISSSTLAKSTITWPSAVASSSATGTVDYVISNPTTFVISSSSSEYDWHYASRDNTLWTTSDKTKSIYDPCPAGWRVPDGESNGVWSIASGMPSYFSNYPYDSANEGMNFSGMFGHAYVVWYPLAGVRSGGNYGLYSVGDESVYWSASLSAYQDCYVGILGLSCSGHIEPSGSGNRAHGCSVRCVMESTVSGSPIMPETTDLSSAGTANCYVVSESGMYKIKAVKGNSTESVGDVASAEVLWETFGTNENISYYDLIKSAFYEDGYISFQTSHVFREGNAVIAAKDASGKILWSWHIWLTDQPEGQEYYNNAGTMMDRNLGATSAAPGDVGAFGLLYQWGRKDPFLGSSSDIADEVAKSSISWPSMISSNSIYGTIEYTVANPTTFIVGNESNNDWYYTGDASIDETRWTTSDKAKSIYDPCPMGWRVPDGGENGVWSKALGSASYFSDSLLYDFSYVGMNFSGRFGADPTIWYPASGYRNHYVGGLGNVNNSGFYWSASLYDLKAYHLYFANNGDVRPSSYDFSTCADGYSVRCVQE